jgi:hypothetical protein
VSAQGGARDYLPPIFIGSSSPDECFSSGRALPSLQQPHGASLWAKAKPPERETPFQA